jgi:hypothetical protein
MRINDCYIKKVDLKLLQDKVELYEMYNNKKPAYIIMNHKMFLNLSITNELLISNYAGDYVSKLWDIPIAITNNLKDGEVDIV